MFKRPFWIEFIFHDITLVFATTALAVASLVGSEDQPWTWILGIAGFIIAHAIINNFRGASIVHRLGPNYDQVQRRAVRVISDLGHIAGDQFGLWMVDLYLHRGSWQSTSRFPFIQRQNVLSRQLSVSLVDKRPQPTTIDPRSGPHGKCYMETRPLLWFDQKTHGAHANNTWGTFDGECEYELEKNYGVLAVSPLVDDLGKDCVGVLAIHVGPSRNDAFKSLSALNSPQGLRFANDACADLHGFLAK